MKNVLGFVTVFHLADNRPGYISPLGELSTWSRTYSKTKGEYYNSLYNDLSLTTFSVTTRANGEDTVLVPDESNIVLKVADACLRYSQDNPAPLDPDDFRNTVQAELYGEIQNVEFGALITSVSTPLPSWISFTGIGEDPNTYFIWLADEYFRTEYPEYGITVIDPVPDTTLLAGDWQTAVDELGRWPLNRIIDKAQVEKNNNPETYTMCFQYDFVNKLNPSQKIPVNWLVLIYGESGRDEDLVKEAIINRLSSGYPESTWIPIFPDLFKRTEFIIYPRWDLLSVPNVSNLTSLYSPFVNAQDAIDKAVLWNDFYPPVFIEENVTVFPLTYKSITLTSINGLNNAEDQRSIYSVWGDYICVDTGSPDFQRMQPLTQDWVHFMVDLVSTAETAGYYTPLNNSFKRVTRGNKVYLTGSFNKAKYFVLLRQSLLDLD